MPVSELHRRVAAVALSAAAGHGFALGGGNALLAHGVISRPTQDVDLFTDQQDGAEAAAAAVEAALRGTGFHAQRRDLSGGLDDVFPGMGEGLAEWIVTAADGEQMMLQLAYFDRSRDPVVTDIGPVLDLEDVAGGKVCALGPRRAPGLRRHGGDARPLQPRPADRLRPAPGPRPGRPGLRRRRPPARPPARPGVRRHRAHEERHHCAAGQVRRLAQDPRAANRRDDPETA